MTLIIDGNTQVLNPGSATVDQETLVQYNLLIQCTEHSCCVIYVVYGIITS